MLRVDGREEILPSKCDHVPVALGDRLYFETWGGGGWGDPLQRDPSLVARDVTRGLVTPHGATRYGVVVDAEGAVDEDATRRLRSEIEEKRDDLQVFDFGGSISELKARCLEETGLPAPAEPRFGRRDAS
jgi:N-methylhydantoinase B